MSTRQVTIVALVNYANTHFFDQLGAIYQESPSSKPSKQFVVQKKRKFYRESQERKVQERHAQIKRLRSRRTLGGEYVVFLDEWGDVGFREVQTEYVCSAFMVAKKDLNHFRSAVRAIISDNWRNTSPGELHFTTIPTGKLDQVLDGVTSCFSRFGIESLTYIVQKPNFFLNLLRGEAESRRGEEKPVVTNIAHKLADPDGHVGRKLLAMMVEEIILHIGVDAVDFGFGLEFFHDRKHRSWMNAALEKGFQRGRESLKLYSNEVYGKNVVPTMTFAVVDWGICLGMLGSSTSSFATS